MCGVDPKTDRLDWTKLTHPYPGNCCSFSFVSSSLLCLVHRRCFLSFPFNVYFTVTATTGCCELRLLPRTFPQLLGFPCRRWKQSALQGKGKSREKERGGSESSPVDTTSTPRPLHRCTAAPIHPRSHWESAPSSKPPPAHCALPVLVRSRSESGPVRPVPSAAGLSLSSQWVAPASVSVSVSSNISSPVVVVVVVALRSSLTTTTPTTDGTAQERKSRVPGL